MRWSTLVFSVTLFYSLSSVNAIPHDIDEKRHWLRKPQDPASSSLSGPSVPSPSAVSSPAVSASIPQDSLTSSLGPSSSLASLPSSSLASQPTSDPSSSTPNSPDSASPSLTTSSSSTDTRPHTSTPSPSTTTNYPNNRDSTSNRHFSSTIGIPSGTSSANGNSGTGNSSGTSFLQNKAAMGSTFAIVGLIGAAILTGAAFFLIKKLRQRKEEEEFDTYFEKLPANHGNNATGRNIGGSNDFGLGPSAADLTVPANSQTFMSRDVHYGSTNQYPSQPANYNGFEYPPARGSIVERPASYVQGTAYAAAMSQRGQYHYEGQVQDPNTVANHPFADPDNRRY